MLDLVERLRFYAKTPLYGDIPQEMFDRAADEIERLMAENAKLLKGIELLGEAAKLLESEMKTLAATLGVTPSGADVPEMADIRRRATEHFGVPL